MGGVSTTSVTSFGADASAFPVASWPTSGAEAARRLGVAVGSVFVAKHRFQKALQQEIQSREGDGPC
jgi:hypothetical protein